MKSALTNLKLNSGKTIMMVDGRFNNLNVYFKSPTGKPLRKETWRGDGWDILSEIAAQNGMTVRQIVHDYSPAIFAEKVKFDFHLAH